MFPCAHCMKVMLRSSIGGLKVCLDYSFFFFFDYYSFALVNSNRFPRLLYRFSKTDLPSWLREDQFLVIEKEDLDE